MAEFVLLRYVLYEMTVGQPPFPGEGSTTISSIVGISPRPVTQLRTDVPLGLERILEKCLAKNPGDRYPSARDLLEALKGLRHKIIFSHLQSSAVRCRTRLQCCLSRT